MSTSLPRPLRPKDRRGFEIAIICALSLEADAVEALFDHYWDDEDLPFDKESGDPNAYSTGVIGRHNVVLSYMPGMGIANAAAVASNCGKSFLGIKLALVVDEIVLGDVIISDGIIQYDFGRQLPGHFSRKNTLLDSLGRPNQEIRGVLAKLRSLRHRRQLSVKTVEYLDVLRQEPELRAEYPGVTEDRLFKASYRHTEDQKSCKQLGCSGELVSRSRLETAGVRPMPAVYFGLMASKNSEDVIAFEMEGAGVWDSFPCIVIKGACDYSDSHKSKDWQQYAAAVAAACIKAFLSFWAPSPTQDISYLATTSSLSRGGQDCLDQTRTAGGIHEGQIEPVFLVPFSKNDLFAGRKDILVKLQGLLFEQGRQKVAMIALQLAFWVKENKPDYSECVKLVKALGLRCSEGEDTKDTVRQHLSSKDIGKWFLIFNNADDVEIIYRSTHPGGGILSFLSSSDNGRTLFTTRSKQVAVTAARTAILELPQMHTEEATDLLRKSLSNKDELDDSKNIVQLLNALTYLPLAIAQAAAYMNVYGTSIMEHIQLHEEGYNDEIVSFDRIRRTAPAAADLLSFMACIKPKGIPQSILPKLKTEQQMTKAIGTLTGHGFLSQREGKATFDMHSLIESRILSENEPNRLASEHELAQAYVADGQTKKAIGILEHIYEIQSGILAEHHPNRLSSEHVLARAYISNGQIKRAIEILDHVVQIREGILAEDHPDRLASEHILAGAYIADGQTKKAIEMLEHVDKIQSRSLAEGHPNRLASEHVLAGAYLAERQTKKAIEVLEHVVQIREGTLAESHPDRLASEFVLARAYVSDGQIKQAVEMLEYVVRVKTRILAENDPSLHRSQRLLQYCYKRVEVVKG
ncbi:hypothetical protein BKA59DRAFT_502576 [Fusarium tricinctum]|uniref:Nucleoside phosphorylase domain-containing protein n=1 Tax=Fusarium tricinctum TaxID=61284 RepID=A0A8K0RPI7_9HYPO|nr:hypothetical protein BKA59DRAFT_502576 [Fusarium tricinctum]